MDVWVQEDPYRSLEDPESLLQAEIERSLNDARLGWHRRRRYGPSTAGLLVGPTPAAMLASAPIAHGVAHRATAMRASRGLATALLRVLVETLSARGVRQLASGASAATSASLRWHLTRGFQLAPDPVREAMRRRPRIPLPL